MTALATGIETAPYLPFMDPRMARAPGLMPLDPAEWFVIHDDFAGQMAYRDRLIAERREIVLALLPEGREAAEELLEAVLDAVAALPGYRVGASEVTRPDGVSVALNRDDPLASAGRLVPDDLCLMQPDAESGEYRLVGAVLCFPSRWLLSEKLGRPLTAIHDPVPDYDEMLARRVNRVFEAMRAGRGLWRVNWILHETPELYLPLGLNEKYVAPEGADGGLYLRTERQTLVRLPRTGAVVFGIKTSVSPVETLTPDEISALRDAIAAEDPSTIAYKSGAEVWRRRLARLEEIACQAGAQAPS
jgi:hypothetical protein